jgi:hypothetical protein
MTPSRSRRLDPGTIHRAVIAALVVTVTLGFVGHASAQEAMWRLVDNPYQEDLDYTLGTTLTPRVEIDGVRWRSFLLESRRDPNLAAYDQIPVDLTVEVENRSTQTEKVLIILLLEDADGAPLDRIEVKTFKIPSGRLKERTQSADILGQVLLDTRRVYAFFEVLE